MLTSLKVVRIALVDCDCSSRSATRARSRLIGTRCSGRSPRFTASGAATAAAAGSAGAARRRAAGGAAPDARRARARASAARTSPLVTRPSLPVPATVPAASWLSAISLAAAGIATPRLRCHGRRRRRRGLPRLPATGLPPRATAPALPSVSIVAMTSSLTKLSPSFLTSWAITPAAGAGTSSTTLSVSISTRISSIATASPGCFFQVSSVASATDSESCGTLISTIAM